MDPITRACQAFLAEAEAFWQAGRGPVLPMIAAHSDRSDLVKALRLKELALDNRRPMFLYEVPFEEQRAYFEGFAESVRNDYEQIRKGAEEEGVILPRFRETSTNGEGKGTPLERAVLAIEQAAALLGDRLDGVLAALVPERVVDGHAWRESIAVLARMRLSPRVRWAVFNPPGGTLNEVFRAEGARFHVDPDELVAFLKQLGPGKPWGYRSDLANVKACCGSRGRPR